jgi:hypothetical protein
MGKLTDEQKRQLAELEAARDAPDDTGDDDVEWWEDGKGGRGGRMRASRARSHGPDWLRGMLEDRKPDGDGDGGQEAEQPGPKGGQVKRFQSGRRVG